jgi:hypothetical protein
MIHRETNVSILLIESVFSTFGISRTLEASLGKAITSEVDEQQTGWHP